MKVYSALALLVAVQGNAAAISETTIRQQMDDAVSIAYTYEDEGDYCLAVPDGAFDILSVKNDEKGKLAQLEIRAPYEVPVNYCAAKLSTYCYGTFSLSAEKKWSVEDVECDDPYYE